LAGFSPARMTGLDPAQCLKKRVGWFGLLAQPAQIVSAKGVFGKTHPYALSIYFIPLLF